MEIQLGDNKKIRLEQLIKSVSWSSDTQRVKEAQHYFRREMEPFIGQAIAVIAEYGYPHGGRGCTGASGFHTYSGTIRVGMIVGADFALSKDTFLLPTARYVEGPAGWEGHNVMLDVFLGKRTFWNDREGNIPCHYREIPGTPCNREPVQHRFSVHVGREEVENNMGEHGFIHAYFDILKPLGLDLSERMKNGLIADVYRHAEREGYQRSLVQECLNLGLHKERLRVSPQSGITLDGAEYLRGVAQGLGLSVPD